MLTFDVLVRGRLTVTMDGVPISVPRGNGKVHVHEAIASLFWSTEDRGVQSVVVTAERLEELLEACAIMIVDPAQIYAMRDTSVP